VLPEVIFSGESVLTRSSAVRECASMWSGTRMHSFMPPHFMNSFVRAVTPVDVTDEWTRTGPIGYYWFRTWSSESSNLRRYGRASSHATFRAALLRGAASLRSEIYNLV
jgi:hypothetical protein